MHLIARRSITNRNNKYSKFSYCKNIKHVLYPLTGQSLKLKNWILCPSYTTTQISCEYFSLTHVDSKLWQTLCSVFQCFGQWHAWISDNFSVTLFLYWSSCRRLSPWSSSFWWQFCGLQETQVSCLAGRHCFLSECIHIYQLLLM